MYAPCNDSYSDEDKDSFFLSDTINSIKEQADLYVMGDFNGRVEERRTPWTKHLGPHSDHRTPCKYNGNHLLELCAEHDLIVTNTFFQHRDTQIYTWYKWNDIGVLSQIDFTLARSRMRCNIRDSRAIPNAGLGTDHMPVIPTLVTEKKMKFTEKKKQPERLNMHKLQDKKAQTNIKCTISEKLSFIDRTLVYVDEASDSLKSVLDTLKEACGTKKTGGRNRKATAWWSKEVKDAIKGKEETIQDLGQDKG